MKSSTIMTLLTFVTISASAASAAPITWGGPAGMSVLTNPNAMSVVNANILAPQNAQLQAEKRPQPHLQPPLPIIQTQTLSGAKCKPASLHRFRKALSEAMARQPQACSALAMARPSAMTATAPPPA